MARVLRNSNGFKRNRRSPYERDPQVDDISTFCALNLDNGDIYHCKCVDHACAFAFGNNKRTGTRKWLAIYRGAGCFICL